VQDSEKTLSGYENLHVWQQSMDLVVEVYELVKTFPREELYALTDQIKRSAVSIPSNIAEGGSRNYRKEFVQFLYISLGSAAELETQLRIAERVGYAQTSSMVKNKVIPIKKMLNALIKSRRVK
jgi:four helix bundle protein